MCIRLYQKIDVTICPNPFSKTTEIRFFIGSCHTACISGQKSDARSQTQELGSISLKIYDLAGRLIKPFPITNHFTGSDGQSPQASRKTITIRWDGRDDNGKRVESGAYFCQLKASNLNSSKKLILLD